MNFVTTLFELIKCLLLPPVIGPVIVLLLKDFLSPNRQSAPEAERKLSRIFMAMLTRLKYFQRKSHTKSEFMAF
jgi:hypothetical protein